MHNVTRILGLMLCGLALRAAAQPRLSAETRYAIHALGILAKREPDAHKLTAIAKARFPVMLVGGRCMVGFLGHATNVLEHDEHVLFGARAGDIVSFRVDVQHLDEVGSLRGFDAVEVAKHRRPALNHVIPDIRADSVYQGIGLPQGYNGHGVLIGITDAGFDYTHPAFYDTAMNATRIVAVWDQLKQSGPAPPGYGYGSAFLTPAEIIAAACDTAVDGVRDTHGTHVAGIAASGGAGTVYRGVAYDAGLLFVTLNDDAGILDGFAWMQQIAQAEQKRLVINMSWASMDLQDGTSLFSQAIDALAGQGIFFAAANGNNGGTPLHFQHAFANDTVRTRVGFALAPDTVYDWRGIILLGEPGNSFSGHVIVRDANNTIIGSTPWMATATQAPYTDTVMVFGADTVELRILADAAHPQDQRPHLRVLMHKTSTLLRVDLGIAASTGTVHGWNAESNGVAVGFWGEPFLAAMPGYIAGDLDYAVGEPACGQEVLGVGAYEAAYPIGGGGWAGSAIADFSSKGPSLDGRLKPDITAPGVNVVSCISSYTTVSVNPVATLLFQGRGYIFGSWGGTSMSSPVSAGVAALLLEAFPWATPAQLRTAIMQNARTDAFTGPIPAEGSTSWGMGKINAYRAALDMLAVAGIPERMNDGLHVWPNPTEDAVNVHLDRLGGQARFIVQDMTGRVVLQGSSSSPFWSIGLGDLPAGVYALRVSTDVMKETLRIVKQ